MSSLRSWIERNGKRTGERQRLHERSGVSLPAIDRACKRSATYEVAVRLHEATGGEVEVWRMTRSKLALASRRKGEAAA